MAYKINDMEKIRLLNHQYTNCLMEASLHPLITISVNCKITDMNQPKVNITGIERDKLIGINFYYIFYRTTEGAQSLYRSICQRIGNYCSLTFCHKDGKLTDMLFCGSVYKDTHENVLGARCQGYCLPETSYGLADGQ